MAEVSSWENLADLSLVKPCDWIVFSRVIKLIGVLFLGRKRWSLRLGLLGEPCDLGQVIAQFECGKPWGLPFFTERFLSFFTKPGMLTFQV